MNKLYLHNTLTKKKEEFIPVDDSHVRMYTCGPTVYNYAHIGNARPAVVSDLLVMLLRYLYPKVTYVSNITDIDDKIIKASKETNKPINEITKKTNMITISIGSGNRSDAQFLFAEDILGCGSIKMPRHAKQYRNFNRIYENLQKERIA